MTALLGGLVGGLAALASPPAVALLLLGSVVGIVFGVVPGLGGIVLLVVLLPFIYNMSPLLGLTLLLGAHSAIYYAASTTAILLNTPGAAESAATCIDGYAMTRKGQAARALGISAAATTFGGWFGAIVLVAAIPLMLFFVTLFHPPEYFFLVILAVVLIGQLQSGSVTKGILSGAFGFMISFVGDAPSTGTTRFTFGNLSLYDGFSIAVVAIGLFAVSQMFILFGSERHLSSVKAGTVSYRNWDQVLQGIQDVAVNRWLVVRSAAIGVLCGVIPGIGSTAANFISYGQAIRTSKHPELFGTGTPEGIIAPEGSSISKEAGALIPTVALGVPNGPAMAVLLSAFAILGIEPGPTMLTTHLTLVFSLVWVLAISSLLASVMGLALAPVLAKISTIPGRVLVPFIFVLTMIGAYASTTDMVQVLALVAFGVIGLTMKRYGYSLPAAIVGLVLGSTAENNVILTQRLFGWSFLERPVTDILILAILGIVISGVVSSRRARRGTSRTAEKDENAPIGRGELVVDVIWVALAAGYVALAVGYPPPSNVGPTLIGGAALVIAVVQLIGGFVPSLRRVTHGSGRMMFAPVQVPLGEEAPIQAAMAEDIPAQVPAAAARTLGEASDQHEQWVAVAIALALYAGIYLFGYFIALPAFMLLYFLFVHRQGWAMAVVSAAAIGALAYGVVALLLGVNFPTGLVPALLGA